MTSAQHDRRNLLDGEVERAVSTLVRDYRPDAIYLFGSLAAGTVGEWSDADLVVIKDSTKPFLDRVADVLRLVMPRVGMDILVYTPAEWERLCRERPFFRQEILAKGKKLYAA